MNWTQIWFTICLHEYNWIYTYAKALCHHVWKWNSIIWFTLNVNIMGWWLRRKEKTLVHCNSICNYYNSNSQLTPLSVNAVISFTLTELSSNQVVMYVEVESMQYGYLPNIGLAHCRINEIRLGFWFRCWVTRVSEQ